QFIQYFADSDKFILAHPEIKGLMTPVKMGEKIYKQVSFSCHSIDGSRITGPSFKGVWGRSEDLEGGGKVVVDEEYVQESLWEPNAKIVKSYPAAMPTMKGRFGTAEVRVIIEYLKTGK